MYTKDKIMAHLNIRLMRKNLSDTLNRTYYQSERIVVTPRKRPARPWPT